MSDTKPTLIDRLHHMEQGHKDNGMMFSAEVCFHAANRIEELEAENRLNYLNSVAGQKKVIELETKLAEIATLPDEWVHSGNGHYYAGDCAEQLKEVLEKSHE